MTINPLQATVDAISQSANEDSGTLITRLREPHSAGRDDGSTAAGSPTTLTSPSDVFSASDVGKGIDFIKSVSGFATGIEGSYVIASYVDPKNVTLTLIDGSAPAFPTQDPIRWKFSTLRVETVLDFPSRDRQLRLWVGSDPSFVTYAERILTAGAQEFRGLGDHRLEVFGQIDSGSPTTLFSESSVFTAGDVGRALWVLGQAILTGNEGPQLITAVSPDGKSATVSPGGFSADEDPVWFVVKSYESDRGYLSVLSREQAEVVDGSQSFSSIDRLRRAILIDFAASDELDRIGRTLAVDRLFLMRDEIYRCLLKTLAYLPKATIFGLELVLECLFPGGGYSIYEDLINFPNKVFILLPELAGDSVYFEGKTFLAPTGKDVTPPIDQTKAGGTFVGAGSRERQASTSATSAPIAFTPISVVDVLQEQEIQTADMDVLPSVDTPAWSFIGEADSGPIESDVFSLVTAGTVSLLQQTPDAAPSDDGGRYRKGVQLSDYLPGSSLELSAWFKVDSHTSSGGFPWGMNLEDAAVDAEAGLFWNLTTAKLASTVGGSVVSTTHGINLLDGNWHHFSLCRCTEGTTHTITASIDGKDLFGPVDASLFASTAFTRVSFGYFYQAATTQDWVALWNTVRSYSLTPRNHWNYTRQNGSFSGADDHFDIGAAAFAVGDVGKHLRIRSGADLNVGLWNIKTYVSPTEIVLEGIPSGDIANVKTIGADNFITLLDPYWAQEDLGKKLTLSGSTAPVTNDGDRIILEVLSPELVRVDGAAFTPELGLSYAFKVFDGTTDGMFVADTSTLWELIEASSVAGTTLTLRDALPAPTVRQLQIWYTSVLSAQLLRNETVQNEGSAGSVPNIFYPFYLFDVDRATRKLMDEITAAGVFPAYERKF